VSDDGTAVPPPPQQTVLRVHHGVLIDFPIVPGWGSQPWAAVVWRDDRAAGGWGRAAMAPGPAGRGYVTNGLTPGDVVEFGADYRAQIGRKSFEMLPRRWYGVVLATDPDYVVALGPFPHPETARHWAERALDVWRQSVRVNVPGVTDVNQATPALAAPRDAAAASPVEVLSDGQVTRVDDATHGTLIVHANLFGAAMDTDAAALAGLLADTQARTGQPELTGHEPKATLAALVAIHTPESLAVEAVEANTEPLATDWSHHEATVFYGHPDGTVELVGPDREARVLVPQRQWSPDGFSWGYQGDGPKELAYALLLGGTGQRDVARRYAQRYSDEVVAALPQGQAWSLPVASVTGWAVAAEQQRPPIVAASRRTPSRDRDAGAGL
jgi:Family of unknown function (DUF6166)